MSRPHPSVDLVHGPACCVSAFLEGRMWGRAEGLHEGYRRGWRECDDEISTLQRAAAEVVWAMAKLPVRDWEADEAAAQARRDWWARRRGEVV